MKSKLLLLPALLLGCTSLFAQNNTYPWPQTGNIGIGTTSPINETGTGLLTINGTSSGGKVYFGTNNGLHGGLFGKSSGMVLYASPNTPVLFNMNGYNLAALTAGGNMAIGFDNPSTRLEVSRPAGSKATAVFHSSGAQAFGHVLTLATDGDAGADEPKLLFSYQGGIQTWAVGGHSNNNRFSIWENGGDGLIYSSTDTKKEGWGAERLTVAPGGNVGIGTSIPDQKLTVNGTIHALKVIVESNVPGPDYVFEKDYKLRSLKEVEAYIKAHKHLPEVASAKEMAVRGIDVNEMNFQLLQKVEELTLYMIELKKENVQLKAKQSDFSESLRNLRKNNKVHKH